MRENGESKERVGWLVVGMGVKKGKGDLSSAFVYSRGLNSFSTVGGGIQIKSGRGSIFPTASILAVSKFKKYSQSKCQMGILGN